MESYKISPFETGVLPLTIYYEDPSKLLWVPIIPSYLSFIYLQSHLCYNVTKEATFSLRVFLCPEQRNVCSGLDLAIEVMGKQKDCCRWWLHGNMVKWVLRNLCQRDTSVNQSYEATICSCWSRMASSVSDILCDVGSGRKLSS